MNAQVGIIMGSKSDWEIMSHVSVTLETLGITFENRVISAHRAPKLLTEYCESARDRGIKILVCGAGLAAALPGVAAAHTSLPVLGVPMESRALGGMDALLSIVQMPRGVPVATFAIGEAGSANAALYAIGILAITDEGLATQLDQFRKDQQQMVYNMELPPQS